MKSFILTAAATALLLASCSGNSNQTSASEQQNDSIEIVENSILGKWNIENVVISDSVYARPAEITPDVDQYISFEADSTYSIVTNCNSINGSYILNGDSIALNAGPATLMACENMQVEDLIKQVLPEISTIDFENDSTLRLNTSGCHYIVLRKAAE